MAEFYDVGNIQNDDYIVGTGVNTTFVGNSGGGSISTDTITVPINERIDELEKTVKLLTQYIIELNKQLENEKVPDTSHLDDFDLPF